MTINDAGKYLIDKVANMKINDVGNDLIGCVANMKIKNVGNDLNTANMIGVQVKFVGYPAGKTYQILLSSQMIGIRHKKVPVMIPPTEPSIGTNNQQVLTIITGVVQAQKALKSTTMEEVITITTAYNMEDNRTPQIFIRTGVDGSTLVTSGTRDADGSGNCADSFQLQMGFSFTFLHAKDLRTSLSIMITRSFFTLLYIRGTYARLVYTWYKIFSA